MVPDRDAAQGLWREFCAATGADPASLGSVEAFGDSAEMADELVALVLAATKRATAGLVADFAREEVPLPEVGGHWIAVDGAGTPRCVLRTTEIRVGLLNSVDEAFARDEGEGERTREWWLTAHRRFFHRQAERTGIPFDEAREAVVFERFEVIWPPTT